MIVMMVIAVHDNDDFVDDNDVVLVDSLWM